MITSRFLTGSPALIFLLALAACGSGDRPLQSEPAATRTLAYAVTQCHEDAHSSSFGQKLLVVRGEGNPITVAAIPTYGRLPVLSLCPLFGGLGDGTYSVFGLAFQRLAVSLDGSAVVFEVSFASSLYTALGVRNPLTPEQEGIFFVDADGTGLRRLGDPSREPAARLSGIPGVDMNVASEFDLSIAFSPDGKAITFLDRGPGPAGEDATQVSILDIATGKRALLTKLPDLPPDPSDPLRTSRCCPSFKDDATISFGSRTDTNGLNGGWHPFTVKTDGTELTMVPDPVVLPGSQVDTNQFRITPALTPGDFILDRRLGGTPVNPSPFADSTTFSEIFELKADRLLQLTNFRRTDTSVGQRGSSIARGRAFFTASANPFGTNLSENCQIFSIDTLGSDLQQLTFFRAADHATVGCLTVNTVPQQPGCFVHPFGLDARGVAFTSSCDPFGTNSSGGEIFVMGLDGSGLRQISATSGFVTASDGSVDVELAGPAAYTAPY